MISFVTLFDVLKDYQLDFYSEFQSLLIKYLWRIGTDTRKELQKSTLQMNESNWLAFVARSLFCTRFYCFVVGTPLQILKFFFLCLSYEFAFVLNLPDEKTWNLVHGESLGIKVLSEGCWRAAAEAYQEKSYSTPKSLMLSFMKT